MNRLVEEQRKLETTTAHGSTAIPIPQSRRIISIRVEPASRATSDSENEAGDHDAAYQHAQRVYDSLETETDPDGPPTTDFAPIVLEGLAGKVHAILVDASLRNCVVVVSEGPLGGQDNANAKALGHLQMSPLRVA